jgi:hypothetical protein
MSTYPPNLPDPVAPLGPLEYTMPARRGRPGILTAIGVISIVIACLSGLVSLWGTFAGLGFLMMSTLNAPARVTTTGTLSTLRAPGAPAAGGAGGTVTIGGIPADLTDAQQDGLPPRQRQLAVNQLARIGGLDAHRQKHLDLLLAAAGKKVFPSPAGPLTTQAIKRDVTDFGVVPSPGGGSAPSVYFVVGTGRIEVYDDHAIYRPDGSMDVVSASANEDEGDAPASPPSGASSPPSPATSPAAGADVQMSYTLIGPGGSRTTTLSTRGRPGTAPPPFPFRVSTVAAAVSLGESALSLGLAIFLLIAGILVLRDSPKGARLHWVYVAIKIPLVIVAVVASWWVWSGFASSLNAAVAASVPPGAAAPPPPAFGRLMFVWAIMGGLLALAYPVGLIFALSTRTVRNYYNAVRE